MTDFMLQASTRQNVLDDLADAIGETLPEPNQVSSAGNLQKIWGDPLTEIREDKDGNLFPVVTGYLWRILISWKDNYSSGLKDGLPEAVPVPIPETRVNRGLHINLRVVGDRGGEIAALIKAHFEAQSISGRDMSDAVWVAQKKDSAGQVHKTSRGTSWLQGDDPAGDGYVADQSFRFG